MENKALVTVILPTYRHAPFIAEAIESVLMQKTDFAVDILLHDDASDDGTREICREYAARYPERITAIVQEVNRYQSDRRIRTHYLYPRVTARYTAILEGDDYWVDPCKLQKQVDYMEAHPDCTLIIGGADIVDVDGRVIGSARPYDEDRIVDPNDMIIGGGGFSATCTILTRTAVLQATPEFCNLVEPEDITEQLWCMLAGYAYYLKDTLGAYRWAVPGSWTMREFASGSAKLVKTGRDMAFLNRSFDELTGGRYHAAFEEAENYAEYLALCGEHRLRELKRPPYRRFYKRESFKRRIRLHLEKYCPRLAAWYIKKKRT